MRLQIILSCGSQADSSAPPGARGVHRKTRRDRASDVRMLAGGQADALSAKLTRARSPRHSATLLLKNGLALIAYPVEATLPK